MMAQPKLSLGFYRLLHRIYHDEKVTKSEFKGKNALKLLGVLEEENVLRLVKQGRGEIVQCPDKVYFVDYFAINYQIEHLEAYIKHREKDEASTRAEALKNTGNDKFDSRHRVFEGFFVKSCLPIIGKINNQNIALKPIQGSWIFIQDYQNFEIEEDITVVGVENVETFARIEHYQHLFQEIKPLFLLRYHNNSYIEWLQRITNPYLHFGDFDLSGVAIYVTEFRNKLSSERCQFFIPENIENLIDNSKNRKDYIKQLADKRTQIDFENYPEISNLVRLIRQKQRTVLQEALEKYN